MEDIQIGILVNTHGLQGEVKVKYTTDFPELRFKKGNEIFLNCQGKRITLRIERVRESKGMLLIVFEGYYDINQVEIWKGSALTIDKATIHELAEDEAYYFELKGCMVKDCDGNELGIVSEIIETSANAVLRVKQGEREFLVPYVKAFIKDFKRDKKEIIIEVMDGLL